MLACELLSSLPTASLLSTLARARYGALVPNGDSAPRPSEFRCINPTDGKLQTLRSGSRVPDLHSCVSARGYEAADVGLEIFKTGHSVMDPVESAVGE